MKWDDKSTNYKAKRIDYNWSRGEEIITDQYPEVLAEVLKLEDCVLDESLLGAKTYFFQNYNEG